MTQREISINIQEVRRVETDAQLVAENVALQLERRVAFRRAMKKSVTACLKFGAQGIKISCSGRLGGRRSPAPSGTGRAGFPSIPCGRISITVCRSSDHLRGRSALKSGFTKEISSRPFAGGKRR